MTTSQGDKQKKYNLFIQIDNGIPHKSEYLITVSKFKLLYPQWEGGVTTICEPPIYHIIAKIDSHTNLWINL